MIRKSVLLGRRGVVIFFIELLSSLFSLSFVNFKEMNISRIVKFRCYKRFVMVHFI